MSEQATQESRPMRTKIANGKVHFPCDFCGKYDDHPDVLVLLKGPEVGICSECIDLCTEIVAEKRAEPFYDLRHAP